MANLQIKDLPAKGIPVGTNILHIDDAGADKNTTVSQLGQFFFSGYNANNTQAIAGVSDAVWMTPAKVDLYIDERVATDAEAIDPLNNLNLMTPAKVSKYLETNQTNLLPESLVVSGGGLLEIGKSYIILDSLTYTLPNVTTFTSEKLLELIGIQGQEPIIQVQGSNGELCLINNQRVDSAFILDINSKVIPVYNDSTNRWEV